MKKKQISFMILTIISMFVKDLSTKRRKIKNLCNSEMCKYIIYILYYIRDYILLWQKYLNDALTEVIFLYDSQNRAINLHKNE